MIKVNGIEIKSFTFPGGEQQVNVKEVIADLGKDEVGDPADIEIEALLKDSDDIMQLLLVVNAIKHVIPFPDMTLDIPYLPYARQDRVCSPGEANSLYVMSQLINSMGFYLVRAWDCHSNVAWKYINNFVHENKMNIIEGTEVSAAIEKKKLTLVSPDRGAEESIKFVSTMTRAPAIYCTKKRNPETGEIINVDVPYNDLLGKDFMVMDDICDGGATFIALAKQLKAKNAGDLYLYVTHGIFSKGLSELREYYKDIFCYHRFNKMADVKTIKEY